MYSKEITPSRCLNSLCRISDIAARQRCLFFFLSLEVFVTTRVSAQPFLRSLFLKGYYQRSTAFSRHENFSPFTKKQNKQTKIKLPELFCVHLSLKSSKLLSWSSTAAGFRKHPRCHRFQRRVKAPIHQVWKFILLLFCTACQDRLWQRFDTRAICHIGVFSTKCVGSSKQWAG